MTKTINLSDFKALGIREGTVLGTGAFGAVRLPAPGKPVSKGAHLE